MEERWQWEEEGDVSSVGYLEGIIAVGKLGNFALPVMITLDAPMALATSKQTNPIGPVDTDTERKWTPQHDEPSEHRGSQCHSWLTVK